MPFGDGKTETLPFVPFPRGNTVAGTGAAAAAAARESG